MKKLAAVLMCISLMSMANALTITNGDFEADPTQTSNVTGWFDTVTANAANWWESTWAGPNVSPTGTSVMGLSYMWQQTNWAYQSIGVNTEELSELKVRYDVGSFTDAGSARDLGVTVSIYASDGAFVGADNLDISTDPGVTLIDSVSTLYASVAIGSYLTDTITLDLSTAGSSELFILFENFAGNVGEPWVAIDNISIVPEPATMILLGLGGLLLRRRR